MFDELPLAGNHSCGPPPPDGHDWPDNWPGDWPGDDSDDDPADDSTHDSADAAGDDRERHDQNVRPDDDATEAADQQGRPGTDEPT